jgi:CheY-like chemotaxis protein
VIAVGDGDDAFARVCESRPDLVLADVLMPGRSGYELAEAIAEDVRVQGTPVLLLSGAFEPFDEGRAERCGAVGHLTKPFQSAVLIEQVERALARSGQAASNGEPNDDLLGVLEAAGGEETAPEEPLDTGREPEEQPFGFDDDGEEAPEPEPPPSDGGDRIRIALPGEQGFAVVPPRMPLRELAGLAGGSASGIDADELRRQLQRKVDELAPEIIREVAWEVVPDLLERLLREAAEWPPAPGGRDESGEDR